MNAPTQLEIDLLHKIAIRHFNGAEAASLFDGAVSIERVSSTVGYFLDLARIMHQA